MIPRNLAGLVTDALNNEWDTNVEFGPLYRSARVTGAEFHRGEAQILFLWSRETGRLVTSEINHTPTPYRQCVALLRSKEN